MIRSRNSPTRPLARADGPILLKGRRTLNRRLVRACGFEDGVGSTVGGDAAFGGGAAGGVVGAVIFDDVVFDEGACGPAVDGEVAVSVGAVGAREVDGSIK